MATGVCDVAAETSERVEARGGVAFITSLFTDFLVDAHIEITEYEEGEFGHGEGPSYYNVYSLDKFREQCIQLGAERVEAVDFEIDVDLPFPSTRHMRTYTRRLTDDSRLQISGPLLMPWKSVAVHMAEA